MSAPPASSPRLGSHEENEPPKRLQLQLGVEAARAPEEHADDVVAEQRRSLQRPLEDMGERRSCGESGVEGGVGGACADDT